MFVRNSELLPHEWVPAWVRTLLTDRARGDMVDELTSIVSEFHPAAMRVAIRAFAEADLRDVLPDIDVPTLLLYGEEDVQLRRTFGSLCIRASRDLGNALARLEAQAALPRLVQRSPRMEPLTSSRRGRIASPCGEWTPFPSFCADHRRQSQAANRTGRGVRRRQRRRARRGLDQRGDTDGGSLRMISRGRVGRG